MRSTPVERKEREQSFKSACWRAWIVAAIGSLCLLISPLTLAAQEIPMTMSEAVQEALQNSPDLSVAREAVIIEQSRKGEAFGLGRPQLIYAREGVNNGAFAEQKWAISQPIRSPWTSYQVMRTVDQSVRQAEEHAQWVQTDVTRRAKEAYVRLIYEQVQLEWIEQELELARELRRIALARSQTGEIAGIELMEAEVELSVIEQEWAEGRASLAGARARLRRVMGWTDESRNGEIRAVGNLRNDRKEISRTAVLDGLAGHDRLAVSRQRLRLEEQRKSEVVSRYSPDLRIDVFRQDFGNGFDFHGFEVGLSIPLWFAFSESPAVKQQSARIRQARWGVESDLLSLQEEALAAWEQYRAARETLQRFEEGTLDQLEELLERTREGYRVGDLDLFRVVQAQRHHIEGQRRYHETLLQYALSRIALEPFLVVEAE